MLTSLESVFDISMACAKLFRVQIDTISCDIYGIFIIPNKLFGSLFCNKAVLLSCG